MAFTEKDGIPIAKQHLNLSRTAAEVVENDMFAFSIPHRETFINLVFQKYYKDADASISIALNKYRGDLEETLEKIGKGSEVKTRIIERLVQKKRDELISATERYERGEGFKFSLNKDNLKYLTGEYSECREDAYYSTRGKYIRSVIEEYARLPFVEREKIIFGSRIEMIEEACNKGCQLKAVIDSGRAFWVYPFKIMQDPLSTANYLVGYSVDWNEESGALQPCSFRIAALKDLDMDESRSAHLTDAQKKKLTETIASRGVQFMIGSESEIIVEFHNDAFNRKYKRQTHLRPMFTENMGNNRYKFQCTEGQALFYFFKFGEDAEIIEPESLRNVFKEMYERAVKTYE